MKLRNKNDGTITEGDVWIKTKVHREPWQCKSLEELNEHWEDYKPIEPLIKDEKIRKAVRAWAKANNINSNHYYNTDIEFDHAEHSLRWINTSIEFNEVTGLENLEDGKSYTIAELCGDDEK